MRYLKLVIFIISLSIFLSCNSKKSVKDLTKDYSLVQLEKMYQIKIDTSIVETNQEILTTSQETDIDTLHMALKVLYGPDDRRDFFQEKDTNKINNANGVVALVRTSDLEFNPNTNTSELSTISLSDAFNICLRENFSIQPTASFCTGFVISKNIIVTAGHCIKSENDLKTIRFLFDFKYIDSTNVNTRFGRQLILTPKRIRAISPPNSDFDYAIIEVNETIPSNRILSLNTDSKIANKQPVYVIGHPVGLPLKIAAGSFVRDNTNPNFFIANLDTYGGNSGSPVFNSKTHKVEGILVKGSTDFISTIEHCRISNPCPDSGCDGESVSRVSQFLSLLKF